MCVRNTPCLDRRQNNTRIPTTTLQSIQSQTHPSKRTHTYIHAYCACASIYVDIHTQTHTFTKVQRTSNYTGSSCSYQLNCFVYVGADVCLSAAQPSSAQPGSVSLVSLVVLSPAEPAGEPAYPCHSFLVTSVAIYRQLNVSLTAQSPVTLLEII